MSMKEDNERRATGPNFTRTNTTEMSDGYICMHQYSLGNPHTSAVMQQAYASLTSAMNYASSSAYSPLTTYYFAISYSSDHEPASDESYPSAIYQDFFSRAGNRTR